MTNSSSLWTFGGQKSALQDLTMVGCLHNPSEGPSWPSPTCYRRLHFQHALLLAEDVGPVVDDLESRVLFHAALFDEVVAEQLGAGFAIFKQLFQSQLMLWRVWHSCRTKTKPASTVRINLVDPITDRYRIHNFKK